MNQFAVTFHRSLSAIGSDHRVVEVDAAGVVVDAQKQWDEQRCAMIDLIQAMDAKVSDIQNTIAENTKALRSTAFEYAFEILHNVLQNDSALSTARLQSYLDVAFEEGQPDLANGVPRLLVHNSMLPIARKWISEHSLAGIEVDAANDLVAGDCRIEINDTGLFASLDAQMQLIRARVAQANAKLNSGDDQ